MSAFSSIAKIPELKRRILFTLLMLAVYRLGCQVPTPGVDPEALMAFFARQRGTIFGLFDMFSGGALERLSVFALGIMPYISASIIIELLKVVIPALEKLYKEGEAGQKKIKQYTRYGTVVIAAIQGLGIAWGLESMTGGGGHMPVVLHPGWAFRLMTVLTLTSGTAFIMWLGEMITERGIGNGISLIIFAGIVARLPSAIIKTFELMGTGEIYPILMVLLIVAMVVVVGFIVFVERGQRRIQVQYARRVVGRRMYGRHEHPSASEGEHLRGHSAHLRLVAADVPGDHRQLHSQWTGSSGSMEAISPGGLYHELFYVGLIIFFCYFYTAVTFNPVDVADNLKKWGGYVPGLRPGKPTAEYIDRILTRITLGGAVVRFGGVRAAQLFDHASSTFPFISVVRPC